MITRSEKTLLRRSCRITATVLAVGACLGAMTLSAQTSVRADDQGGNTAITKKVSLNLVNQPVQTALRLLFTSVGLNNSIDQDVQGYVTIDVNDVSFDVALRSLLNAANPPLAYDVQGGVYHISIKRQAPPIQMTAPTAPTQTSSAEAMHFWPIPINSYDAGMIAQIIANDARGGVVIVPPNYPAGGQGGQGGQGGRGGQGGFGQGGQGGMMGGQGGFGGGGMMGGGSSFGGNSFGGGGSSFGGGGSSFGGGGSSFGGGGFGGY